MYVITAVALWGFGGVDWFSEQCKGELIGTGDVHVNVTQSMLEMLPDNTSHQQGMGRTVCAASGRILVFIELMV